MAVWQKYLFDRSFDDPSDPAYRRNRKAEPEPEPEPEDLEEEEEQEPEPEPEPTFSEAELTTARNQGFNEGKMAGKQEAWSEFRVQTDQMAVKNLTKIGEQIEEVFADHRQQFELASKTASAIAYAAVKQALPVLEKRHGLEEINEVIQSCVEKLFAEPRITIRINDALIEPMQARLGPMLEQAGFEGKIVLQADGDMGMSDSRVSWDSGSASRDMAQIWHEVEAALKRVVGDEFPEVSPGGNGAETDMTAAGDHADDLSASSADGDELDTGAFADASDLSHSESVSSDSLT